MKLRVVFFCGDRSPYGLGHLASIAEIFNLSPFAFNLSMNLRSLAETALPAPLFLRLPALSIAKRLAGELLRRWFIVRFGW